MYENQPDLLIPTSFYAFLLVGLTLSLIIAYYIIKYAVKEALSESKKELYKMRIALKAIGKKYGVSDSDITEYHKTLQEIQSLQQKIEANNSNMYAAIDKEKYIARNNELAAEIEDLKSEI